MGQAGVQAGNGVHDIVAERFTGATGVAPGVRVFLPPPAIHIFFDIVTDFRAVIVKEKIGADGEMKFLSLIHIFGVKIFIENMLTG